MNQKMADKIGMVIKSQENRILNIVKEPKKRKMKLEKGQVWTCDFGENVGGELNGIRPCLVFQSDSENKFSPTAIVVPINKTCNIYNSNSFRLEDKDILELYGEGYIEGFLLTDQIRVVSKGRMGWKIGKLTNEAMNSIGGQLRKTIGL